MKEKNQPRALHRRVFTRIFYWILLVSVVLRLLGALYMGNRVEELPGTADQISYHTLALRVLNGHGFTFDQDWWPVTPAGEQTAHWSFLYTFYLVGVYALFGPNPLVARILQAVMIGILHPFLAYRLGRETAGERVGLITAGLTAGYAYFIYYAGALMTEPFYITAILAALYLSIRATKAAADQKTRVDMRLLAALGLVLGCAVLLRQLFLMFVPFLLLWTVWKLLPRSWGAAAQRVLVPLAVIALLILPFVLFNYTRFGRPLLNTNAGYALFWGNHPVYGTRFVGILPPEMGTYPSLIPQELLGLDEAALDGALMQRGLGFILADPGRYALLSLSRIPVYFQFWPSAESGMVSNLSRVASFGLLWPFMVYGLARFWIDGRLRRIDQPGFLLVLFAVIYTGIHLLSWALIRYRLPVDAVLLVPAGLALLDLYQRLRARLPFAARPTHPA